MTVWVSVCVCDMYTYICTGAHSHACACRGQGSTLGIFLITLHHLIFDTGSVSEPGDQQLATVDGQWFPRIPVSPSPLHWHHRLPLLYLAFSTDAANPTPGPHAYEASHLPTKPSLQLLTLYFKLSDNKIYLICLGKQFLTDWIIPEQETICNQFKSSKENVPREIPQGLCACFPIMGNTVHTFMPSGHGKSSDKTCQGRCLPKTWYVGSGPPSSRSRSSDILQQHQRREVYSTPWAELSPVGRDQLCVKPCIKRKRLPENWTYLCPFLNCMKTSSPGDFSGPPPLGEASSQCDKQLW